jgi:DNA-binding NarL/FixJ family response regulator
VSIVSGSQVLREGLVLLLASRLKLDLIGSYPAEPDAAGALPNPPGHVVLVDGGPDCDLTVRWTRYWHRLPDPPCLIVIELADDIDMILACIEAGATGYVLRGEPFQNVAVTIETARRGAAYCSPEVTAQLFARLAMLRAAHAAAAPPSLTTREREVLRYIACHYSNQRIADALVIEVRTVKHHVHNILEKLKLRHRWEAARVAIEQHWFTDEQAAPLEQA